MKSFVGTMLILAPATAIGFADDLGPPPKILDNRLELQLFAEHPDIVTPVGIASDGRGRLFVIESHTHLPDEDYEGPTSDRIKILEDADGDGKADTFRLFADGFDDAMNLAFSHSGGLYVCHRAGVTALFDRDGDDVAEDRSEILKLETKQSYAHNCMLGITIAPDGWLYASRGNTGGYPYAIIGTDGSEVRNYGDGGNIVRCRLDGSDVEEVATGFWNPFDMGFDSRGRLNCVDNDPDSRGPNRLVHVVMGGDYGFRSLYGPSGLHPYDAWNGELPGTLPLMAGTGEAPSGVLCCNRTSLPADFAGDVLVTSWGAHAIERFRTKPTGVSLTAERDVLIQGGEDFRPVAIRTTPDGSVFITDWVLRYYPNHGHGRIWKLSTKAGFESQEPRSQFQSPESDYGVRRLEEILAADSPEHISIVLEAAQSDDAFVRSAAVTAFSRSNFRQSILDLLSDSRPAVRLAALLALRKTQAPIPEAQIRPLLSDCDENVRLMALVWIGESMTARLKSDLNQTLKVSPLSPKLVETFLATHCLLTEAERSARAEGVPGFQIRRPGNDSVVLSVVKNDELPVTARALALSFLSQPDHPEALQMLCELANCECRILQFEAVRILGECSDEKAADTLSQIAFSREAPATLRADAIAALARHGAPRVEPLVRLLDDTDLSVVLEIVRTLRSAAPEPRVSAALKRILTEPVSTDSEFGRRIVRQAAMAIGQRDVLYQLGRPSSDDDWRKQVLSDGDADRGRRVFFSSSANCARCHQVGGRGGIVGPNLSVIGRSANRERLLWSILRPSEEIAPQFMAHTLVLADGTIVGGIQFHFRGTNAVSIIPEDGNEVRFNLADVESYRASTESLMPENLVDQLTVDDVRDLLAFFEGLD